MRKVKVRAKKKPLWDILRDFGLELLDCKHPQLVIAKYIPIIHDWKDTLPKKAKGRKK